MLPILSLTTVSFVVSNLKLSFYQNINVLFPNALKLTFDGCQALSERKVRLLSDINEYIIVRCYGNNFPFLFLYYVKFSYFSFFFFFFLFFFNFLTKLLIYNVFLLASNGQSYPSLHVVDGVKITPPRLMDLLKKL